VRAYTPRHLVQTCVGTSRMTVPSSWSMLDRSVCRPVVPRGRTHPGAAKVGLVEQSQPRFGLDFNEISGTCGQIAVAAMSTAVVATAARAVQPPTVASSGGTTWAARCTRVRALEPRVNGGSRASFRATTSLQHAPAPIAWSSTCVPGAARLKDLWLWPCSAWTARALPTAP
jgi:hypothetical protein